MPASAKQLTSKQEAFCRSVVSGSNLSDAYRTNYSAENMCNTAIRVEASRLMANPKVSLTVMQLNKAKDAAVIASAVSDKDLVLGLLRDVVRTEENVTAQLRAAELLGRACSLFTDVVETKQARDPAEIEREIRKLLAMEDSANAA